MGREIGSHVFKQEELVGFQQKLRQETAHFLHLSKEKAFCEDPTPILGLEIESWLVDEEMNPTAQNSQFLDQLDNPLVVPELSQYNFEINAPPLAMSAHCFSTIHQQLNKLMSSVNRCTKEMRIHPLFIGSLPTLKDSMLDLDHISDRNRYRALNSRVMELKSGSSMHLDIRGDDQLLLDHNDIMLEAAATSLQIHYKIPYSQFINNFNASIIASAAIVGVSANSPFLFGKSLWDETRIAIFEQAVNIPGVPLLSGQTQKRVTFGEHFLKHDPAELFVENLDCYPVLLPFTSDASNDASMPHLRLHNGNIWRWNRGILGLDEGKPHLRIEHRTPSSGPTVIDMVGNIAFYIGLTHHLAQSHETAPQISFAQAKENFYQASQKSLQAHIKWGDKKGSLQELILEVLLPFASQGLADLGVDPVESDFYLEEVIGKRVKQNQTGAQWQKNWLKKYNGSFKDMMHRYLELQQSNQAVCNWDI